MSSTENRSEALKIDESLVIIRPQILNLRWWPESQTEPDDDTSFEFEIKNCDTKFSITIRYVVFELGSRPNAGLCFPGQISSLYYKESATAKTNVSFFSNGACVEHCIFSLAPNASRKLYGVLTTSTQIGCFANYDYPFTMKVSLNWEVALPRFEKDAMVPIDNVIKPD